MDEEEKKPSSLDEQTEDEFSNDIESEEKASTESQDKPKRSAENRIKELLGKNKELEDKLNSLEEKIKEVPSSYQPKENDTLKPSTPSPQVQKALEFLKSQGFVSKDEVQDMLKTVQDRQSLDGEHLKLERKYDGNDGRPTYDRSKVEEVMRSRGIYDPEVAYETIHKQELLDWELKKLMKDKPGSTEPMGSSTSTEVNKRQITLEKIEKAKKSPEGRAWYDRNRDKILKLLMEGQL